MANPIQEIIDIMESLTADKILAMVLEDNKLKELVVQLNTKGQKTSQLFEQGIDARGVSLKQIGGTPLTDSGYAPFTIEQKKIKGQRFSNITLEDTGAFYASWQVKIRDGFLEITADGRKADVDLFQEWGHDIVGLTDENIDILTDEIAKRIPQIVTEALTA